MAKTLWVRVYHYQLNYHIYVDFNIFEPYNIVNNLGIILKNNKGKQLVGSGIKIEWYSGYTLYDSPRRIFWLGHWLEVASVLQRNYTPNGTFLKIITSDQLIFNLRYSLCQDIWQINQL